MDKYVSIKKAAFTEDYLMAIFIILDNAGYTIEEDSVEFRIYFPQEYMQAWALKMFYECNLT